MTKKKGTFYKNDLKFYDKTDATEIEDDFTKELYHKYKNKPKIELRIDECIRENYNYFDLSHMKLDDKLLEELLSLKDIEELLSKIHFLDLSNNILTRIPDIKKYKNIKCIDVSYNKIKGDIINNNWSELVCKHNHIETIKSESIERLIASDNEIDEIDIPNIKLLVINNNKIKELHECDKLNYCEIMNNKVEKINKMDSLTELYIADNNIKEFSELSNIKILNCANNKIDKIPYYSTLEVIVSTTPIISKKYTIENIEKVNLDYIISIKK